MEELNKSCEKIGNLELNKIYCMDALEGLKHLEDKSINCILIDPPYNIGYAEWDNFNFNVFPEFKRILKENGQLFIFAGWSFVTKVKEEGEKYFTLKDWIIYDRQKGRGTTKSLVSTREDILWFVNSDNYTFNKDKAYSTIIKKTKGMGRKNGKETRALSNVWTDVPPIVPWSKERVNHPTQKPLFIIKRILEVFTNQGDLIVDCYVGSGTTALACKEIERDFVCFDKSDEYCKIANGRLNKVVLDKSSEKQGDKK